MVALWRAAGWDIEMVSRIDVAEFKDRLAELCLRGGGWGIPRKHRDQHILFKSVTLMLETERAYPEGELNECLAKWLSQVGRTVEIDHVSLRRYLVDTGYLTRDSAGRSYQVDPEQALDLFEVGVDEIDPVAVVEEAYRVAEKRKRKYIEGCEEN
jgi:hypothetical protein